MVAKLLEPILADTVTLRQKRVMTGNGSIVGAGTGGLSTNDITVATTGQQSLNVPQSFPFQSSKSNGEKIKLVRSDPMMIMSWGLSDQDYEAGDDQKNQKRIRSVSADRILDDPREPREPRDSLSPDQRRVRSCSADRILDGERSRQDSLSSLRTLESQSSDRSWGGYRPAVSRRRWRSSWLGSPWESLSATEERRAGRFVVNLNVLSQSCRTVSLTDRLTVILLTPSARYFTVFPEILNISKCIRTRLCTCVIIRWDLQYHSHTTIYRLVNILDGEFLLLPPLSN